MDMFETQANEAMAESRPLAERMRPRSLNDFVGQDEAPSFPSTEPLFLPEK